jgi:small-conductance mechanosensitive channel
VTAADIDAALAADNTAKGGEFAAQAKAALPTVEAKRLAWASLVDSADLPNTVVRSSALGFVTPTGWRHWHPSSSRTSTCCCRSGRAGPTTSPNYLIIGLYPALANAALRDATRRWLDAHQDAAQPCVASCGRTSPGSSAPSQSRSATRPDLVRMTRRRRLLTSGRWEASVVSSQCAPLRDHPGPHHGLFLGSGRPRPPELPGRCGRKLITIAVIILSGLVLAWLMRRLIARIVDRIVRGAKNKAATDTRAVDNSPLAQVRIVQRTRTLGSILQNIVNTTIVIIALILVVFTINANVLGSFTLLTAALGAGLGFGAQNIVKDVLNGIFIVAEDQVGIGDVVDLGLATGVVEYVSVRVTHVRDVNGTLWYVRNGEITRIGNMSQGWSRVIIDLAVPADAEIGDVEKSMLDAAKGLAKDPKWRTRLIDQPEIWGLESISGTRS